MCEDVIKFYDSCYFVRKKYVLKSLDEREIQRKEERTKFIENLISKANQDK